MFKYIFSLFIAVFISIFPSFSQHSDDHASKGKDTHVEEKFNMGEMIMHHIKDEHGWELTHHTKIPLPVIFYSKQRGIDVMSSADFDHNKGVFNGYKLEHNHAVALDASGKEDHSVKIWDFSITKNVASLLLSAALLLITFLTVSKAYKKNSGKAPKGVQSFVEPIILFIRDEVVKPNIGKKYVSYMPYLLTLFFFILFNNLMGLLPGAANLSGNITVTFALAILTFIIVHINAKKAYWMHLVAPPGVPVVMYPLFWVIEIVGVFMKPASLTIRLFANITGGHIIILSLLGLIFIFKNIFIGLGVSVFTIFMSGIEIMVAFIQAFIFTLLSSMYIGSAIEEHHHDDHH